MTATRVALIGLVTITLGVTLLSDKGFAAALPGYFADEWVGILCVNAPTPVAPTKVNMLIQMNFDKSSNGGITLAKADQLFDFLRTSFLNFSGTATQTCALKPSQVNSQYHVNGLQAAQQLTGTYPQYGFQLMVITDNFWSLLPDYLDLPANALSLKSDTFIVVGSNSVTYRSSDETLASAIP